MRLLVLLGNQVELWESTLAAMKLGAVIIPATTLLAHADLRDRIDRGHVGAVIARSELAERFADVQGCYPRIAVGEPAEGWLRYADSASSFDPFSPDGPTDADDPLLLYFTSGTTALPKLVEHTHISYPIGHLSTMYWIGLQPGDVHLNVSSPGWAKHAWSCVFAPWIAGATVCMFNYERFDAKRDARRAARRRGHHVLRAADGVADACPAGPRRLEGRLSLRELVGAGEPLNPEVIEEVRRGLGHDGPRRLRADRDHAADRQPARPAAQGRLDGAADARLPIRSSTPPPTSWTPDEGEICVACAPTARSV